MAAGGAGLYRLQFPIWGNCLPFMGGWAGKGHWLEGSIFLDRLTDKSSSKVFRSTRSLLGKYI